MVKLVFVVLFFLNIFRVRTTSQSLHILVKGAGPGKNANQSTQAYLVGLIR